MNGLNFGTAGIPLSTEPRNTLNGLKQVRKLGLNAMELEFVHSVNLSPAGAEELKKANDGVVLTSHASYYVNLNAKEPEKRGASRSRILQAAQRLTQAGGYSVTFHPAFYLGMEKESVYDTVKEQLSKVVKEAQDKGITVWIRPETTGKGTQFGDLKELIRLSQDIEQVLPCVDFAHLHARTGGKNNTPEEFKEIMTLIEKGLGRDGLNNMHIHMSGIEYSEKGERHHLFLEDSDFNWRPLVDTWKEFKIKGAVISESPNIEKDALLMKKYYGGE